MSEHTAGPWAWGVNPKGNYTNELVVRPAGEFPQGLWIADVGSSGDPEREANACLIAAAPELLEACEAVSDMCGPMNPYVGEDWEANWANAIRMMRLAIAKARGRGEK
jgi:hypothetical protein